MNRVATGLLPLAIVLAACTGGKKFSAEPQAATLPKQETIQSDPADSIASAPPAGTTTQASATDNTLQANDYVKTQTIGINFEDTPVGGDSDYNDAVLCFNGSFNHYSNPEKIESAVEQEIKATATSLSGCTHQIEYQISHADGTQETITKLTTDKVENATETPIKLKKGDLLDVWMTTPASLNANNVYGCDLNQRPSMKEAASAQVLNECHKTGK